MKENIIILSKICLTNKLTNLNKHTKLKILGSNQVQKYK